MFYMSCPAKGCPLQQKYVLSSRDMSSLGKIYYLQHRHVLSSIDVYFSGHIYTSSSNDFLYFTLFWQFLSQSHKNHLSVWKLEIRNQKFILKNFYFRWLLIFPIFSGAFYINLTLKTIENGTLHFHCFSKKMIKFAKIVFFN